MTMFSLAGFFAYAQEPPQTSEELIQFDRYRRMIENRLRVLGDDAIQRFEPFVLWMRQMIAEKAPELLDESSSRKEFSWLKDEVVRK